jgi:hypothetical protein
MDEGGSNKPTSLANRQHSPHGLDDTPMPCWTHVGSSKSTEETLQSTSTAQLAAHHTARPPTLWHTPEPTQQCSQCANALKARVLQATSQMDCDVLCSVSCPCRRTAHNHSCTAKSCTGDAHRQGAGRNHYEPLVALTGSADTQAGGGIASTPACDTP